MSMSMSMSMSHSMINFVCRAVIRCHNAVDTGGVELNH